MFRKQNKRQHCMRMVGIVAAALLTAAPATSAELLVPDQFATINAAIEAAVDGDEIVVSAGTYAEAVDFLGKAVIVRSADGADVTTLEGDGTAAVVLASNIAGSGARLAGFEIVRVLPADGDGSVVDSEAAIVVAGAEFTLADSVVSGFDGLDADNATLTVDNCTFIENTGGLGGGIDAYSSDVTVRNSTFENNSAGYGGGIGITGGSATIDGVTLIGNTASQFGGAIYLNHVVADIRNVTAIDNGEVEIFDTYRIFRTGAGGALYAKETTGVIANCDFDGNGATAGGGIYLRNCSEELTVANVLIRNSLGAFGGAAIYVNTGFPMITNATVVNNDSGIFAYYNSAPTLANSIVANNGINFDFDFGGQGFTIVERSLVPELDVFDPVQIGDGVIEGVDALLDDAGRPLAGSPAIDAGDNSFVPSGVVFDLDGNARFVDDPATDDTGVGAPPLVDLGAFEFQAADGRTKSRTDGKGRPNGMMMPIELRLHTGGAMRP